MEITLEQHDQIINGINLIKLPKRCSCERINKEIYKVIGKVTKTDDPHYVGEVCCPICCGCHIEKI
jgi:hypothetical protein